MPYPAMIVPLAVFFAARDGTSVAVSDEQRRELTRWFWRSCYGRRFSGGVLRSLNRDLQEARKLRASGGSALADVPWSVDAEWFVSNRFTLSAVNTKTFVLTLVQAAPLSFVSGAPINLAAVLKSYNRAEFHHVYPRAFLLSMKVTNNEINRLANFAIISAADNKTLGGKAPSVYKAKMPAGGLDKILEKALCGANTFDDDYAAFVATRAANLATFANSLADC